jgi:cell division cycle 20, cofactor of APC complex
MSSATISHHFPSTPPRERPTRSLAGGGWPTVGHGGRQMGGVGGGLYRGTNSSSVLTPTLPHYLITPNKMNARAGERNMSVGRGVPVGVNGMASRTISAQGTPLISASSRKLMRAYSPPRSQPSMLPTMPQQKQPFPHDQQVPVTPSRPTYNRNQSTPPSIRSNVRGGDDDRFIPSRRNTNLELCRRALVPTTEKRRGRRRLSGPKSTHHQQGDYFDDDRDADGSGPADASSDEDDDDDDVPPGGSNSNSRKARKAKSSETALQKEYKRRMLSSLCNIPLENLTEDAEPMGLLAFGGQSSTDTSFTSTTASTSTTAASSTSVAGSASAGSFGGLVTNPFAHDMLRTMKLGGHQYGLHDDATANHSVANKVLRKVPSAPVRVLDAPDIVDDYYLNLINWSRDNILAVALARSVYLWNAASGEIHHLLSLDQDPNDYVTSVNWCTQPGMSQYIAVGTNSHAVHVYDGHELQRVNTLSGHTGRVSALSWNQQSLSSGGRDSVILNHDIRAAQHTTTRYVAHEQEICGLKWNDDSTTLASGGNENFLCLWDAAMSGRRDTAAGRRRSSGLQANEYAPRLVLDEHRAAVKALDWCPFHRGLLASGGGTIDRTIKFWNTTSGTCLNSTDTGSQVCSIVWSRTHHRELVSSHGYSENQLIVWKYPTMMKVKELKGHTARVLHMDLSPDATTVVSAAADETLRFWNIFGSDSTTISGASSTKKNANQTSNTRRNLVGSHLTFGGPTIR